jgi:hypothetical protein
VTFGPIHCIESELDAITDHLLATVDQRFVHDLPSCLVNVVPKKGQTQPSGSQAGQAATGGGQATGSATLTTKQRTTIRETVITKGSA